MMSRSRLSKIVAILILGTNLSLLTSVKSCESDTDCLNSLNYVPKAHQEICSNGTCTCPPDYIPGLVYGRFKSCFSPMFNTNQPCSHNCDCSDGEKCLQSSTCGRCQLGRFSSTEDKCEGPFYDDICWLRLQVTNVGDALTTLEFQKECQWEGLHCDSRGSKKCACVDSHYFDLDLKKCTLRPGFGEDCSKSKLCKDDPDSYGYTKCGKNNTCICAGAVKNWTGKSLQQPTGPCRRYHCVIHSSCVQDDRPRCKCGPGYVDSREGECLRFMSGSKCESDPDFETLKALTFQGLECINGFYRCARLTEQYYDVGPKGDWHWSRWRHICVTEVGAKCTGSDDTRCTDGATCVDVEGQFICKCDQRLGYSPTPHNKCLKHVEFGSYCTNDCNHFGGMICQRGLCGCLDPTLKYDSDTRKCLSPVGHFCGTRSFARVSVKIECQGGLKCRVPENAVHERSRCLNLKIL